MKNWSAFGQKPVENRIPFIKPRVLFQGNSYRYLY